MKLDRHGMRPCNRCLKLRASVRDAAAKLIPGFRPTFFDMEVKDMASSATALFRVRMDTGAIVEVAEAGSPELAKLKGRHTIYERNDKTGRLKDRVTLRYLPVIVTAVKVTSDTGDTLSNID